jgi:hypothetical protein
VLARRAKTGAISQKCYYFVQCRQGQMGCGLGDKDPRWLRVTEQDQTGFRGGCFAFSLGCGWRLHAAAVHWRAFFCSAACALDGGASACVLMQSLVWGTCIGFTSFTPIDLRIALQKNYSEDGLMEMVDGKVPTHLPTHQPTHQPTHLPTHLILLL